MKTIESNLRLYLLENKMSRSELIAKVGTTERELKCLEEDNLPNKLLFRMCYIMSIDFRSIYSDTGFRTKSLNRQYSEAPGRLIEYASAGIVNKILKKISPDEFKERLDKSIKAPRLASRIVSGSSVITADNLTAVQQAANKEFPKDEFYELVANQLFGNIPNFNLETIKDASEQSIADVAASTGIGKSSIGNYCSPRCSYMIPIKTCEKIAAATGVNLKVLLTSYFNRKVASNYRFADTRNDQKEDNDSKKSFADVSSFPDPISDKPCDRAALSSSLDSLGDLSLNLTNSECEPSQAVKSENQVDNNSSKPLIRFDDEKLAKMFNSLTSENRAKVDSLIVELFFSQI